MGKGGGGGSTTTTVKYPKWVDAAAKDNLNFANQVAALPYQPYSGPRIAGFTGDETAAQNLARQFATSGQGYGNISAAEQATGNVLGYRPDSVVANIDRYMNPYTQNVIDTTMNNLNRSRDMVLNQGAANAAKAGAFGGSRHGIADAETNRNYFDVAGSTIAGLQNAAYNNALGAAQQDITNAYNANNQNLTAAQQLANLGLTGRALTQQDIDTLNIIGNQQRQMNQSNYDLAYQDFQNQRDYPLKQLAIRQSGLSQTPYGNTTSQSQSAPQSNTFGQVVGTAAAIASLFNAL